MAIPATGAKKHIVDRTAKDGQIRVNDADKTGAIELGLTNIEGRVYKPSVFYVLARSSFNYQGIQLHQDFSDRIVKSALNRPF